MSKFKDFHLYLGQPVKVLFEDEHGKYTVERAGTLSWNHDEDREWIIYQPLPGDDFEDVDFKFKLVLRRLSSMTEEEIKNLFHYDKIVSQYKDISFQRELFNDVLTGITINYSVEIEEGGLMPQSWTMEFCSMNAQDFVWFLRHGFDLFQLIDEGLAIDAATV